MEKPPTKKHDAALASATIPITENNCSMQTDQLSNQIYNTYTLQIKKTPQKISSKIHNNKVRKM